MRDDKLQFFQKSHLRGTNVPNNLVKVIKGGHSKYNLITNYR